MRKVVLVSGGIESLVTTALAVRERTGPVHGVFIDYGQIPVEQERRASRRISRRYGVVLEEVTMTLPFLSDHHMVAPGLIYDNTRAQEFGVMVGDQRKADRAHVVAFRNLMFLSIAASLATTVGAGELWCGFDYVKEATGTRDKSPEFVEAFQEALEEAIDDDAFAPVVMTPLQGQNKMQNILVGEGLGVDWSLSWSCYNNLYRPCGVCAQCNTRKESFAGLGGDEGVDYATESDIRGELGT